MCIQLEKMSGSLNWTYLIQKSWAELPYVTQKCNRWNRTMVLPNYKLLGLHNRIYISIGNQHHDTDIDISKRSEQLYTCRPPSAYNRPCISKRIVGTLFPLESYDNCMDLADTPKIVRLEKKILKSRTNRETEMTVVKSRMTKMTMIKWYTMFFSQE